MQIQNIQGQHHIEKRKIYSNEHDFEFQPCGCIQNV